MQQLKQTPQEKEQKNKVLPSPINLTFEKFRDFDVVTEALSEQILNPAHKSSVQLTLTYQEAQNKLGYQTTRISMLNKPDLSFWKKHIVNEAYAIDEVIIKYKRGLVI